MSPRARRPRRQRYTVEVEGRDPVVVLAYSHGDAIETAERCGYKVIEAFMGDYRVQEIVRKAKTEGGHRLIPSALEEAKNILGLKLPIKIRYNSRVVGVSGKNGSYERTMRGHEIMLKSYLTPEQVTETLWHELRHAWQAEQKGTPEAWWAYREIQRQRYTYKRRPIEIDARTYATKMSKTHPLLARPR